MEYSKDIQELVVERLKTLPEDKDVSIGSLGEFTKHELIEHVQSGDALGSKIVSLELNFLRTLKEGLLYDQEYSFSHAS